MCSRVASGELASRSQLIAKALRPSIEGRSEPNQSGFGVENGRLGRAAGAVATTAEPVRVVAFSGRVRGTDATDQVAELRLGNTIQSRSVEVAVCNGCAERSVPAMFPKHHVDRCYTRFEGDVQESTGVFFWRRPPVTQPTSQASARRSTSWGTCRPRPTASHRGISAWKSRVGGGARAGEADDASSVTAVGRRKKKRALRALLRSRPQVGR